MGAGTGHPAARLAAQTGMSGAILIVIMMVIVAAILGAGFYTLIKGGEVSANWSNRLMRWRVLAQAVTIVIVLIVLYIARG